MKLTDALSAITAFRQAIRQDTVSETEVADRSRICVGCPVRTKSILAPVVASALKSAPKELSSYVCGICKCPLGLLVPAKQPHVDSPQERTRRMKKNPNCWMLKL